MCEKKFNVKKLQKLNNPQRLIDISVEDIAQKLGLEHPETLVDLGAGTAFFSIAFLKYYSPATLYACDISTTMLDWVKENIVSEYPTIVPTQCEETQTPLDGNSADLVFMICLHHELENPEQTLAESYRILKPGGKVLVVDWKKAQMTEGPPLDIRCSIDEVQNQMENTGFDCLHTSNDLEKHFFVIAQK